VLKKLKLFSGPSVAAN